MDLWHDEIEKAKSPEDVLRGATDFLQCWAPRELDAMNLGLIEMRIESPEDIERVRRSLSTGHTLPPASSPTQAAHLKELESYFSRAAARVQELRAA